MHIPGMSGYGLAYPYTLKDPMYDSYTHNSQLLHPKHALPRDFLFHSDCMNNGDLLLLMFRNKAQSIFVSESGRRKGTGPRACQVSNTP